MPILYRGDEVGWRRLDLLVAGLRVVELKAVRTLEDVHFAMVRSYLRATGRKRGLSLNFAKAALSARRVIASHPVTKTSRFPGFLRGSFSLGPQPPSGSFQTCTTGC